MLAGVLKDKMRIQVFPYCSETNTYIYKLPLICSVYMSFTM